MTSKPTYRGYQALIAEIVDPVKFEPRLVEAWMRLEYSTLDHLDRSTFAREAKIAAQCIAEAPDDSERLARSMGL